MNQKPTYIIAPDGYVVAELVYDLNRRARERWYRPWYPFAGTSRPENRGRNLKQIPEYSCFASGEFCESCG